MNYCKYDTKQSPLKRIEGRMLSLQVLNILSGAYSVIGLLPLVTHFHVFGMCRAFVSCVRSIKILSPVEVAQMSQEMPAAVLGQQLRPSNSNSEDAPNSQAGGGALDH